MAQALDRRASAQDGTFTEENGRLARDDLVGEVLLATGNAEDAVAFHQEAARMHQQLGDSWHEALASVHLADAEQALEDFGSTAAQHSGESEDLALAR